MGDVKADGDEATVRVKLKGISQDDMLSELDAAFGEEVTLKWIEDHQEEAMDYAAGHTQEELRSWIVDQVLPEAGKEDGDWKVSSIGQRADS